MKKTKFIFLFLILLVGFLTWVFIQQRGSVKQFSLDEVIQVERSDMRIGVSSSGTINAKKNHRISIEARVRCKVSWLVDENTKVKVGDMLIKFDDEDLLNKMEDLELSVANGKKELEIALEELNILYSSNKASLRQSQDNLVSAEEAVMKYKQLEGPREKDAQASKVDSAFKAYQDAKSTYQTALGGSSSVVYNSKEEEDKGQKVIDDQLDKVKQKEFDYSSALLSHKVFKRYTYRNKIDSLQNGLDQALLNLQSEKVRAESKVMQKKSSISRIENEAKRKLLQLKKTKENLSFMVIVSPVEGIVIYGDPSRHRDDVDLKVGLEAYYRQTLMTIPDVSTMLVKFSLPEAYRSKVKQGNTVTITPDSLPSLKLKGKVSQIDPLPVSLIRWDRNSPKIYKSEVEIESQTESLVSGMSVKIDITTEVIKDVISVPIESVFEEDDRFFVYKFSDGFPIKQFVTIGTSDDNSVCIASGLDEGDKVFLYNPFLTGD